MSWLDTEKTTMMLELDALVIFSNMISFTNLLLFLVLAKTCIKWGIYLTSRHLPLSALGTPRVLADELPEPPAFSFPSMMGHFTTGTSSFILSKYSRSYPIKRSAPKVQFPAHGGPEFSSDWQHFTNPVIRLILDVKTSSDAEIESVKLRIVWEINNGIETGVNSQNVIFASAVLLAPPIAFIYSPRMIADCLPNNARKIWISCHSRLFLSVLSEKIRRKACLSKPYTAIPSLE